jgi:hypothetical protein
MAFDFRDFYVLYKGNPYYQGDRIEEDNIIRVIIQKYYNLLFTIKGEVLGDPEFGANLDELLHETGLDENSVRNVIIEQLQIYVPEIFNTNYDINVVFVEDPDNYQEMMFINLTLNDFDIITQVGRVG